ncbi:MAG: hypothetical protein Q4P33_01790 [Flaviflexus sp.]|nr:hypothetical protein [Flaviflexus sp.]
MKILGIRFVTNPAGARSFYAALGLELPRGAEDAHWQELRADGGIFALHGIREGDGEHPPFKLCLKSDEPLEQVQGRLTEAGFDPGIITDEDFGRAMRVRDPEGLEIQIDEG